MFGKLFGSNNAAEKKKKKEEEERELNALNAQATTFEDFEKKHLGPADKAKGRISLLILGTGDSGKTSWFIISRPLLNSNTRANPPHTRAAFRKQLLNVHGDQFSKEDFRKKFRTAALNHNARFG